jgi:hypothetical protein
MCRRSIENRQTKKANNRTPKAKQTKKSNAKVLNM